MPRSPVIDYLKWTKSSITTATSSTEKHFGEVPDKLVMRARPKKALHLDGHLSLYHVNVKMPDSGGNGHEVVPARVHKRWSET